MKKLFILATLGVAGLMSANEKLDQISNEELVYEIQSEDNLQPPGATFCWSTNYTDCSGHTTANDTLCWEEGNMQSYNEMMACHYAANEMWSRFNCAGDQTAHLAP